MIPGTRTRRWSNFASPRCAENAARCGLFLTSALMLWQDDLSIRRPLRNYGKELMMNRYSHIATDDCLVSWITGHLGFSTHFSGKSVNQDLANASGRIGRLGAGEEIKTQRSYTFFDVFLDLEIIQRRVWRQFRLVLFKERLHEVVVEYVTRFNH